jgi:LysR family hydrogen peroxide-inducible transcriptional activator
MPARRRLDLPIAPLRAFVAISTHGSFRKAAEALNLTSPAISAQIKNLERIVGGKLFVRKGTGLGLSELGSRVDRHARRILINNDQLIAIAGRSSTQETVRIGIQLVFARLVWPEILKACEAAEGLSFQHVCVSIVELAEKLQSGHLDLVFSVPTTDSQHNLIAGWREQLVWVGAPHMSPLMEGKPIPFVGREGGFMDRKVFDVLDDCDTPYTVVFHGSDNTSLHAATASGLGLMIMPERAVPSFLSIVRDRQLPALPEVPVGVSHREGFDLARHRALVANFVSAVAPPNVQFSRPLNARPVLLKASRTAR